VTTFDQTAPAGDQTDPARRDCSVAPPIDARRPSSRLAARQPVAAAGAGRPAAHTDALAAETWPRLYDEVRTPLNAILGNVELLIDGSVGPLSSQARTCLGDIRAAGQSLMRDLQALLDLCHAKTARSPASGLALDLLEMLERALVAAGGRSAQVRPTDARLIVRADSAWLASLVSAIVELPSPGITDTDRLTVAVESADPPSRDATVDIMWPAFSPERVDPLRMALVDAILVLHGGSSALIAAGVRLHWPACRVVDLGRATPSLP
jgi:signal transduction histidine kinase